jgi:hypothetical protein
LAPFESDYYRGRVDKYDAGADKVSVFFIDFGNRDLVDVNSLIILDDDLLAEVSLVS